MPSDTQRRPFPERARDFLLQFVGRVVLNQFFMRFVLGPLFLLLGFVDACIHAFGPTPRFEMPPGSVVPSGFMEVIGRIQEERKAKEVRTELTDYERASARSSTFGVAGVSMVMLVGIGTSSKVFNGPAVVIAAICFVITVPILIVCGIAFTHQWEPVRGHPAAREISNLHSLIALMHLVFAFGLAAFVWSFDKRVSIVFVIAAYLGWRAYNNLVVHRIAPKTAESLTAMLEAANVAKAKKAETPRESDKTAA